MLQNIVVLLTAISIRIGLLSSKIHNGDDTPKDWQKCTLTWRNELSPSSVVVTFTRLHSITSQKTVIFTAVLKYTYFKVNAKFNFNL
jgi:hypothetical protein